MKYITTKQLKELGACDTELKIFRALFGKRALVSTENVRMAMNYKLSYLWLMAKLLDANKLDAFHQEHKILSTAHEERMEHAVKKHFSNGQPANALNLYGTLTGWTNLHNLNRAELIARTLLEVPD